MSRYNVQVLLKGDGVSVEKNALSADVEAESLEDAKGKIVDSGITVTVNGKTKIIQIEKGDFLGYTITEFGTPSSPASSPASSAASGPGGSLRQDNRR